MNPFYTKTFDVSPGTSVGSQRIEDQYLLVEQGFDAVNVQMLLRGSIAGQVWTGTHNFTGATLTVATPAPGDSSNSVATTSFAMTMQSPAFVGTPTAPTAAAGTATTQIATTAFTNQLVNAVVGTVGAVLWVSGTTYALGNAVYSPIDFLTYRRKIAGAGTTDPSLDPVNWQPLVPTSAGSTLYLAANFGGF